jgi:energy-coupling factor transporter ATP-binding protein EcfA2
MPGSRLNDVERKLLKWWKNSQNLTYPLLKSVSVEGDPGLRGVRSLNVEFNYPLTVISGRNGCGKTTILALAALGFHSPKGHESLNARRRKKLGEDYTYYTFSDFFFKGPKDPDITGVKIKWEYEGFEAIEIRKKTNKWMRYERRPERPVHYLGLNRIVPAIEHSALRSHFGNTKKSRKTKDLKLDSCEHLNHIMGRVYSGAEVLSSSNYSVRTYTSDNSSSSSFNMGAGEDALIDLLYLLQESPEGAIVIIEEIEVGFHPEALIRLAKTLQEIILKKKIQIIVSTHSSYFIDNVPREARVLIQKANNTHSIIEQPTTRMAVGLMSGQPNPELNVYCEDDFARLLIQDILPLDIRKRVNIIPVGAKSQLVQQAAFHLRANFGQLILLCWDGDVPDSEANAWIEKDLKFDDNRGEKANWTFFPGSKPPEKWVIDTLNCSEGYKLVAGELNENNVDHAGGIIQSLVAISDPKDISHKLAEIANITQDEAFRIQIKSVSRLPSKPLKSVVDAVTCVLEGRNIKGRQN